MAKVVPVWADACEVVIGGAGTAPVVLTCEHASMRLPDGWQWPEQDRWLVGSHWSYDIGAAELTRELAFALGAAAVLARFSRLLCDANRAEADPTLFRDRADGVSIALNTDLGVHDRERRLIEFHRPFHEAVDRVVGERAGKAVLSIHSFTPVYESQPREVEVGVLFDDADEVATDFALALADRGIPTWLNEPYSGKEGLIYSADRHAKRHGRIPLELEVRQDLAPDREWRSRAVPAIRDALAEVGLLAVAPWP